MSTEAFAARLKSLANAGSIDVELVSREIRSGAYCFRFTAGSQFVLCTIDASHLAFMADDGLRAIVRAAIIALGGRPS